MIHAPGFPLSPLFHLSLLLLAETPTPRSMRDEELAARIGLNSKEMGKLANKLAEDGFLAT